MQATMPELSLRYQDILKGDQIKEPEDGFKILQRFRHVYSECRRVDKTIECLHNNDIKSLGKLIDQSHQSLSEDYEVSTPEVDELVNILRNNGAEGARIMGAGFGGMVLAVVQDEKQEILIANTKQYYYGTRTKSVKYNYVIPCSAADGASSI